MSTLLAADPTVDELLKNGITQFMQDQTNFADTYTADLLAAPAMGWGVGVDLLYFVRYRGGVVQGPFDCRVVRVVLGALKYPSTPKLMAEQDECGIRVAGSHRNVGDGNNWNCGGTC